LQADLQRTAHEVSQTFSNKLDLIVDSGDARGGKPSTVIGISKGDARLIREGIVSRRELAETLKAAGVKLEENGEA
jgi:tRNA A37 threonylcarbamoyladenosine synthetase subunit TsaC/SUA5/YrdC